MQPSLVVLLLACVALAALGFYLGFVLRVRPLGWLPQATFVFMAALMAPRRPPTWASTSSPSTATVGRS